MNDPMTGRDEGTPSGEVPAPEPIRQADELACELAEEWNSSEPASDSPGS